MNKIGEGKVNGVEQTEIDEELGMAVTYLVKAWEKRLSAKSVAHTLHSYAAAMVLASQGPWVSNEPRTELLNIVSDNWHDLVGNIGTVFEAKRRNEETR